MELALTARSLDDRTVLEVGGEIDVYTAPSLREKIVSLVEAGTTMLIVDLTHVEFLDSTGLGVLVGALRRLRGVNGSFGVVCDQERLLKIFRITALDSVLTIYDSVESASAAAGQVG
jgi:anti-sigma B factor antagonist